MSIYFPLDHTADEWRAMAKNNSQEALDSFQRSDTDGYLSQWASNVMASVYLACANLAEKDGIAEMAWPFTPDHQPVDQWRWVQGKYGSSVMIVHHGERSFWSPSEAKKGVQRLERDMAKGWHWGTIRTEAVVGMTGDRISVRPVTLPKNDSPREVVAKIEGRYTKNKV